MSASSFSGFPADARILGLDIGSISVDVVLLDGLGTPLYSRYVRHHGQPDKVLCAELEALERTHAGIAAAVTGTGADRVGRLLGACAVNEVIAQVAAASFRCPQARSVIDIGGQDSKVILLDPVGGQVKDFLMNDKCAAGTGRFLEMTMSRVGSDIASIDTFVEGAEPVTINSMCAVFAESEIIGLLAQETPPGSIALGCIYSICRRTAIFAQKLAPEHPKVFFSGGLAQSQVVREVLARYPGYTHIQCRLETGRTHQIRVHMAAQGHPVLGDPVYGGARKGFPELAGQCLHARRLTFRHPRTGETLTVECPLPDYFQAVLTRCSRLV